MNEIQQRELAVKWETKYLYEVLSNNSLVFLSYKAILIKVLQVIIQLSCIAAVVMFLLLKYASSSSSFDLKSDFYTDVKEEARESLNRKASGVPFNLWSSKEQSICIYYLCVLIIF